MFRELQVFQSKRTVQLGPSKQSEAPFAFGFISEGQNNVPIKITQLKQLKAVLNL